MDLASLDPRRQERVQEAHFLAVDRSTGRFDVVIDKLMFEELVRITSQACDSG